MLLLGLVLHNNPFTFIVWFSGLLVPPFLLVSINLARWISSIGLRITFMYPIDSHVNLCSESVEYFCSIGSVCSPYCAIIAALLLCIVYLELVNTSGTMFGWTHSLTVCPCATGLYIVVLQHVLAMHLLYRSNLKTKQVRKGNRFFWFGWAALRVSYNAFSSVSHLGYAYLINLHNWPRKWHFYSLHLCMHEYTWAVKSNEPFVVLAHCLSMRSCALPPPCACFIAIAFHLKIHIFQLYKLASLFKHLTR